MHFDENGIRDVTELKVLQYRTAYMNGTPVFAEGSMKDSLTLIEVAYLRDEDNLIIFEGDKQRIWPSITFRYAHMIMHTEYLLWHITLRFYPS